MRTLIALLLIIPGLTFAGGDPDPVPQDQSQDQTQGQDQAQDQAQGQDQSQEQSQNIEISTGSEGQTITYTSPSDIEIKRTVNPFAPSINPTHPCALSWSGGIGVTGVGVSGGKSKKDPECDARETARLFFEFGEREKAIMILCAQPSAEVLADCQPYQDYNREMTELKTGYTQLRSDYDRLVIEMQERTKQHAETVDQYQEALNVCAEKCNK